MSAPPTELINALRSGIVARHLFFYLDHPAGAVRAWDGLGEMIFGGNTYLGVGGLAEVSGVSNSADIQNHSPTVTLNRVPLTTLQSDTSDVRNRAATIAVGYYNEAGTLFASRTLFSGVGDVLITKITETEARLTLKLRGKIADWGLSPRAYYTPNDQAAFYPGVTDTGLSQVRSLENANVSGWSLNEESSGGNVGFLNNTMQDSATGAFMYCVGVGGLCFIAAGSGGTRYYVIKKASTGVTVAANLALLEETTAASNGGTSTYLSFGGTNAYVDVSGDARTGGGLLVYPSLFTTTNKLKRCATISSNGTATAETVQEVTSQWGSYSLLKRSTGTVNIATPNTTGAIINNARGYLFYSGGSFYEISAIFTTGVATAVSYVEDVTNTAVSISGGNLQVSGVNCVISSTGVVLSSGGRRIKRSGADSTTDFLRVIS